MSNYRKKWQQRIGGVMLAAVIGMAASWLVAGANEGTVVHMRVEGQTQTLFDGEVIIGDCVARDDSGLDHALSGVALCGLVNAAETESLALSLQDFGWGLFLAGIGADITPADWSKSWSFWVNEEPAAVGADSYQVAAGDDLLLAFSGYPTVPLRVTAPEKTRAGEQFTVLVEKKIGDYDANYSWQGTWLPAGTALLWVNDNAVELNEDGQALVTINQPEIVEIWAEGEGFVRSSRWQVVVENKAEETAVPTATLTSAPTPSASWLASPTVSPTPIESIAPEPTITPDLPSPIAANKLIVGEERTRAARSALAYLKSKQGADGRIEGDVVTAWSVMSFGADGQRAETVSNWERTLWDGLAGAQLSSATDIERQIMAVLAAGGNPRVWQGRNLVQELRGYLKEGQLGETTIINDDIFGVLAWLSSDQAMISSEVEQTVSTVINNQDSDGAWGSVDLTAAAVQGLQEYFKRGGNIEVGSAIERARSYLRSHQDKYGGFGENLASTAWGIQAITALGEDPVGWTNNEGKTPWQALARYQNSNGGFGWRSNEDVSSFMTAYAVPALLGKAWPITVEWAIGSEAVNYEQAAVAARLGQGVPTVTPALASPAVAGIRFQAEEPAGQTDYAVQRENVSNNRVIETTDNASGDAGVPQEFIPPDRSDWGFVLSLFSLANMGIGVTVARLLMKV